MNETIGSNAADKNVAASNVDFEDSESTPELQLEVLEDLYLSALRSDRTPDVAWMASAFPSLGERLKRRLLVVGALFQRPLKSPLCNKDTDSWRKLAAGDDTNSLPVCKQNRQLQSATVGRFQLRRVISDKGVTSIVQEAYDPLLKRAVAIKLCRTRFPAGSDFAERFEREASVAAQLRHPHIVALHEVGIEGNQPFLVMELVDGDTLEDRLERENPADWEPKRVAALVAKIAEALDYAHRKGIIHRDVKPANILIDQQGQPSLADFGLASWRGSANSITVAGRILGTPVYMSPEAANGESRAVDHRSDVYSLGVVLYRLLTGRLPFGGDVTLEELQRSIVSSEPQAPRDCNAQIPKELETICLKAINKCKEHRFASAQQMADDLRRWQEGEPIHSRRPTPVERIARWGQRHQRAAAFVTTVLAFVISLLIWANWAEAKAKVAQAEAKAAQIQLILETQTKEELRLHSLLSVANQRLETPTHGRVTDVLNQLRGINDLRSRLQDAPSAPDIDLQTRSLLVRAHGEYDTRLVYQVAGLPASQWQTWPTAIHPSGHAMVLGDADRPYLVLAGERFQIPAGLKVPEPKPLVNFSSSGTYVAFGPGGGGLSLWNDAVSEKLATWSPENTPVVLAVGWEATDKSLRFVGQDGFVRKLALPGLEPDLASDFQLKQLKTLPTAAAFNRNASQVAAGDVEGNVVVHRDDGELVQRFNLASEPITALSWSSDSKLLGIATRTGAVYVYDLPRQMVLHRLFWNEVATEQIVFSPDGRWICAGQRGGAKVWDVVSGEQVLTLPTSIVGFAKDGRRFAGGQYDGVDLYDVMSPAVLLPCIGHRNQVIQSTWSANSARFASLDSALELIVWDANTGQPICQAQLPPGLFYAGNRGLALNVSGDTACVAYARDKQGFVQFLDVTSGKLSEPCQVGSHWFFRVACRESNGDFMIVGDGPKPEGQGERETVLYEAAPNQPPKRLRILRASDAGELGGFDHFLTPDARHYIWSGPGVPPSAHRTELWNVENGQRIERYATPPTKSGNGGPAAYLSPSGKQLWTSWVQGMRYHPLSGIKPSLATRTDVLPAAVSANDEWVLYCQVNDAPVYPSADLLLYDLSRPEVVVNFTIGRELRGPHPQSVAFSPDSRKAVWGSIAGRITMLDLPKLQSVLAEFGRE